MFTTETNNYGIGRQVRLDKTKRIYTITGFDANRHYSKCFELADADGNRVFVGRNEFTFPRKQNN